MPLREQQLNALRVLDWLFSLEDEHRASGRSYIVAVALIRQAARFPGVRVPFIDHTAYRESRRFVGELVRRLADADRRLRPHFSCDRDAFQLNLSRPIDNWLPEGQQPSPFANDLLRAFGEAVRQAGIPAEAFKPLSPSDPVPAKSRYERLREDKLKVEVT